MGLRGFWKRGCAVCESNSGGGCGPFRPWSKVGIVDLWGVTIFVEV